MNEENKYVNGGLITKPTLALVGQTGAETIINPRQLQNIQSAINNLPIIRGVENAKIKIYK